MRECALDALWDLLDPVLVAAEPRPSAPARVGAVWMAQAGARDTGGDSLCLVRGDQVALL